MKRVEVVDTLLVMVVEHSQESDDDARERKRVEDRMEQLHVDAPNAAADTVQEHRWKL